MVKNWKLILAVLAIYGAGAASGIVVHIVGQRQSHAPSDPVANMPAGPGWSQRYEVLKKMEKQLDLSPTQHQHIADIIQESQDRMKALWDPIAPKAREEFQHTRELILNELTPAQRSKWEQLAKARHAKERTEAPKKHERNSIDTNNTQQPIPNKTDDTQRIH
jgi:Spy/CpxP family protein refolding chaperone